MLLIVSLLVSICYAQVDSGVTSLPMQPVSVEAILSSQNIPADDTLVAIVRIVAIGDPWQWVVDSFIMPDVQNLTLLSTGIEAEHSVGDQKKTIIKKILRYAPIKQGDAKIGQISLHMLFIPESAGVWLKTEPLDAKIIDPKYRKVRIPWLFILPALAFVLVAGVIAFAFARNKKRKKIDEEKTPSFEEKILEMLSKIDVRRTSPEIASEKIAKAIRDYIARRYNIATQGMSTSEIMSAISNVGLMGKLYSDVEEALELCNDIKFARVEKTPDEISDAISKVKQFIRQTSGGTK